MRRIQLALLAGLLISAPTLLAGEITLLKGGSIKGDILSVTDAEVTYEQGGMKKSLAIKGVLKIDYQDVGKPDKDAKYAIIELTCGSQLMAGKFGIKKRVLEMTLLSGPEVKVPLSAVTGVLVAAHDERGRFDWKSRVFNSRGRECLVVNIEGVISNLDVTFGEGDAKGENIKMAIDVGCDTKVVDKAIAKQHGFIFKHVLAPKAPPILCRLHDTMGNVVMVSAIVAKEGGDLEVATPSGAKLEFKKGQVARLDYTKGKLDPLSELVPTKIEAKSNLDEDPMPDQWHVYKNTNLNKGPLTLGGVVYGSGLAVKPFTELTYDLRGDYRELTMVVGIDDNVTADGAAILVIECDGKEVQTVKISSTDKVRFKPLTVNIKDVVRLKITVKADGDFDTSRHLDLADAKVSK